MSRDAQRIAENLDRVRAKISDAARSSGRSEADVTLVAVTKYVGVAQVEALIDAGCRDLGESRPQELWSKAESLDVPSIQEPLCWHLVGHLQRNKVNRTVPLVSLIHSIDSVRILESVEHCSGQLAKQTPILLEVNVSGEAAKHGFAPDQLELLLERLADMRHVKLLGLMAMAGLQGGRDVARAHFAKLRESRDRLRGNCPADISLAELSMGMSQDFDLAIAEGATIVRVGSALFEGVVF